MQSSTIVTVQIFWVSVFWIKETHGHNKLYRLKKANKAGTQKRMEAFFGAPTIIKRKQPMPKKGAKSKKGAAAKKAKTSAKKGKHTF